jgi:hypothetical protein
MALISSENFDPPRSKFSQRLNRKFDSETKYVKNSCMRFISTFGKNFVSDFAKKTCLDLLVGD